jgi:hypothetical protein
MANYMPGSDSILGLGFSDEPSNFRKSIWSTSEH